MTMLYVKNKTLLERFWLHTNKNGLQIEMIESQCWQWITSAKRGYPQINTGKEVVSPAKFIWEHENGPIPDGMYVIRRCNNVFCVRLDHLRLGTYSELESRLIETKDGCKFRRCAKCKKLFEFTNEFFNRDVSAPGGLSRRCKFCDVHATKEIQVKNWTSHLLTRTKHNAKDRGLELTITEDDLMNQYDKQNGKCFWFGVDLINSIEYKHPCKPSVDRIDITKGYTKDNIVISSLSANFARNSSSLESFVDLLRMLSSAVEDAPWRKVYE